MARTGRFGRLPTEAPDLSSQIVALMEQWQNAEDRNLLDAWENGGKYKGKKVTDKDIVKHYRQRRDQYEKDDPEWDQWNQDLWQIRFRISNEDVMMRYSQGKIGPGAVADHYREWARKMPKDSSYYRSLMATAGDFVKAARQSSARAAKSFDHNAMMRDVNRIQREVADDVEFLQAVDYYAAAKGLIPQGTSLTDPGVLNAFELRDLDVMLSTGAAAYSELDETSWQTTREGIRKNVPGFKGRDLNTTDLRRAIENIVDAKKRQIRKYQQAPYDMSGAIGGLRKEIRRVRVLNNMVTQTGGSSDAAALYADAYDLWMGYSTGLNPGNVPVGDRTDPGRAGAIEPADYIDGDEDMVGQLQKVANMLEEKGFLDDAAFAHMFVRAINGDENALAKFDGQSTFFGMTSDDLRTIATQKVQMNNQVAALSGKKAVLVPPELTPDDLKRDLFPNLMGEPTWGIKAVETGPDGTLANNDPSQVFVYQKFGDNWYLKMYVGAPIRDHMNKEVIGYQWDIEGFDVWGTYTTDNLLKYDYVDPTSGFDGLDLQMQPDGSLRIIGSEERLMAGYDLESKQRKTPREVIDEYVDTFMASPDHSEADKEQVREAQAEVGKIVEDPSLLAKDESLDAWMKMFPGAFDSMPDYGSEELNERAKKAFAREYFRVRFPKQADDPAVKYSEEDAFFVTPEGRMRLPTDDAGSWAAMANVGNTDNANVKGAVASREKYVSDAEEMGAGYNEALLQARRQTDAQGGPQIVGGQDFPDLPLPSTEPGVSSGGGVNQSLMNVVAGSENPYEGLVAGSTLVEAATRAMQQVQQGLGSYGVNALLLRTDPEKSKDAKGVRTEDFLLADLLNSPDDQQRAATIDDYAATDTLKFGEDPIAEIVRNGGSLDASVTGAAMGLDTAMADRREAYAGMAESALADRFGSTWEYPTGEEPETTVPGSMWSTYGGFKVEQPAGTPVVRADSVIPRSAVEARIEREKPQPRVKVPDMVNAAIGPSVKMSPTMRPAPAAMSPVAAQAYVGSPAMTGVGRIRASVASSAPSSMTPSATSAKQQADTQRMEAHYQRGATIR